MQGRLQVRVRNVYLQPQPQTLGLEMLECLEVKGGCRQEERGDVFCKLTFWWERVLGQRCSEIHADTWTHFNRVIAFRDPKLQASTCQPNQDHGQIMGPS